jgi:hypothetical protein
MKQHLYVYVLGISTAMALLKIGSIKCRGLSKKKNFFLIMNEKKNNNNNNYYNNIFSDDRRLTN